MFYFLGINLLYLNVNVSRLQYRPKRDQIQENLILFCFSPSFFLFFFSAFLWQLMRFSMLLLLRNLRSHSQGKEITDTDILTWANKKVKSVGRKSQMDSFKVID